ncbi:MAG: sigma-54-dependent Fis family transcriptional regulator [Deltaproteobacteria bacterium]|nr:sigma-54-dependent Fis family transcriptional regulator [Deltaproteobacteria bacterium]
MGKASEQIAVLVVDDDPSVLKSWREILADPCYKVTLLEDPVAAAAQVEGLELDVAVVDIRMPGMDGMELLTAIKTKRPEVEVVMMTGFGGVQDAVEAIRRGAYDFLSKPFESMEAAELTVRRAAELRRLERRVRQLEREMEGGQPLRHVVGQSEAIKRVIELVRSVAASPATVLIMGESGTGKEMVAQAIHRNSPRAQKALVTLNCSALTETLLESELFGHAKGAFTGATTTHRGLFAAADGGTIFLDEIGDMALPTQVKLLRTIQEGEVRPVGATQTVTVNVRIIAATNVDLEKKVKEGAFRQDLFYRLNVVRIDMPPLRERGEDIPLLAHHFLHKHQATMNKQFEGIDPAAMACLTSHDWPGNVRELENTIERAVVLGRGKTITLADLPAKIVGERAQPEADLTLLPFPAAKDEAVARFERVYLAQQLARHQTVAAAARAAGMDRSNFKRLLKRHGLQASEG